MAGLLLALIVLVLKVFRVSCRSHGVVWIFCWPRPIFQFWCCVSFSLVPVLKESYVEAFFVVFERVATILNLPKDVLALILQHRLVVKAQGWNMLSAWIGCTEMSMWNQHERMHVAFIFFNTLLSLFLTLVLDRSISVLANTQGCIRTPVLMFLEAF